MSDDVLGNVKEAFSGKRGKVLLIGGGIAVAAYVWYVRTHPAEDDLAPIEGEGVNGPATGSGNGAASPQTDPTVGNQTGGDVPRGRPTTNNEWLADGTDFLKGRGVSSGDAYDALSKALGGQSLTTAQIAWVSQVISGVGVPPEGMPPLNSTPPTTTTPPKPTSSGYRGYGWYRANGKETASTIAKKYSLPIVTYYAYNPTLPQRPKSGTYVKVRANSNPLTGYKGK